MMEDYAARMKTSHCFLLSATSGCGEVDDPPSGAHTIGSLYRFMVREEILQILQLFKTLLVVSEYNCSQSLGKWGSDCGDH